MLRLGSALGPGARVEGPGSNGPARAESGGPPTAAGWGRRLAYRWLSGLTASCLKSERALTHARALQPWRVWASVRPVEAEPGSRNKWAGLWASADDTWWWNGEPERTQSSAPQ